MNKLSFSILLVLVLLITNPSERVHQDAIAGKVSFLGDLGALTVSTVADYVNLGLFSVMISKRTDETLSFGFLGKVWLI